MKGGSATKIILEIIFSLAVSETIFGQGNHESHGGVSGCRVADLLMEYEQAIRYTYLNADGMHCTAPHHSNARKHVCARKQC